MRSKGSSPHFARADEADKTSANAQLAAFLSFCGRVEKELGLRIPLRHCANSAGIVEMPQAGLDAVRAGIILYGLWPSDEVRRDIVSLKPAPFSLQQDHLHQGGEGRGADQLRRDFYGAGKHACGDGACGLWATVIPEAFPEKGMC